MIPAVFIVVLAVAVIVLSAAAFLRTRRSGSRAAAGPEPGRPGDRDEAAAPRDRVGFTLYRPEEIRVGSTVQVVAYAHLTPVLNPAPGEPPSVPREVEEDVADRFEPTDRVEAATAIQTARFAPSDVLSFRLMVEGCRVSPGEALVRWEPPFAAVPFRVTIPAGLAGPNIPGRLVVYQGIFVRGTVEFSFRVGVSEGTGRPVGGRAFDKVFPSYSHRDAAIVDYVEEAARTLGHEFLRDVRNLRVGEIWGDEIRGYIEEADLFQLFWSSRSMASPYVRQEWEHALSLGREGFILPVYWEDPLPSDPLHGLPPPELNRIHFHRLGVAEGAGEPGEVDPAPAPALPGTDPGEFTLTFPVPRPRPTATEDLAEAGGKPGAPTKGSQRARTAGSQVPLSRRLPRAAWLSAAALLVLALGVPAVLDQRGGDFLSAPVESGGENPDPGAGGSRPLPAVISVGVPVGDGETLTPEDRSRLVEAIGRSLGGTDGEIRLVPLPATGMDTGDTAATRRLAMDLGISYLVIGWEEGASPLTLQLLRIDTTGMIRR